MPYFNKKPKFALQELWYYFCYLQNNKRYIEWRHYTSEDIKEKIAEKAVIKLKKMDNFLKSKGFLHLVFISPSKEQALNQANKDYLLDNLFKKYRLKVIYIVDRIKLLNISDKEKEEIFYDTIHLSKKGHQLWAQVINEEIKTILK